RSARPRGRGRPGPTPSRYTSGRCRRATARTSWTVPRGATPPGPTNSRGCPGVGGAVAFAAGVARGADEAKALRRRTGGAGGDERRRDADAAGGADEPEPDAVGGERGDRVAALPPRRVLGEVFDQQRQGDVERVDPGGGGHQDPQRLQELGDRQDRPNLVEED